MEKVLLESEDSDENNIAFFVFCLSFSYFSVDQCRSAVV